MNATIICSRPECQTTAGCGHRGPGGECCYFPVAAPVPHGCICPPGSEADVSWPALPAAAGEGDMRHAYALMVGLVVLGVIFTAVLVVMSYPWAGVAVVYGVVAYMVGRGILELMEC